MTTATLTTAAAPLAQNRACTFHGLTHEVTCPVCGKQTYDLDDGRERREVREVRAMLLKKRQSWPVIGLIVAGMVPGFVEGLAQGALVFSFAFGPAAAGAALGVAAMKLLKRPALARLDALLKAHDA
jgi:hypothetical protein